MSQKISIPDRLTPGIILIIGIIFIAISYLSFFKIINYDLFYQLKSGEMMVKTKTVRFEEDFSFAPKSENFVNQEWLSEVVFYLVHALGGFDALIYLKIFIVLLIFALLLRQLLAQKIDPYLAAALIFTAFLLCRFRLLIRPHLFSLFFLILNLHILDQFKRGKTSHVFILIPLLILWSNMHFESIFGLTIIGIYWLSFLLSAIVKTSSGLFLQGPNIARQARHLTGVMVLAALAVLLNPAGYQFYTFPFEIAQISTTFRVLETLSPFQINSALSSFPLFWCTAIASLFLIARNIKRYDISHFLLLTLAFSASLSMLRFIPHFTLITIPILATALNEEMRSWLSRINPRTKNTGLASLIILCVAGYSISTFGMLQRYRFGSGINDVYLPQRAVAFIKEAKIKGNIFNDMRLGGFLIHELYPDNKVFIYGRYTALDKRIPNGYMYMLTHPERGLELLDRVKADIVILDKTRSLKASLGSSLSKSSHWKPVYSDYVCVIYVRKKTSEAKL